MTRLRRRLALLALLPFVGACATAGGAAPAPAAPVEDRLELPTAVHWARTAAEHRAIFLQVYRSAGEALRELVADRRAGTWAVVLDADETVLDNSEYQRRLAVRDATFDLETWNEWVREEDAPVLPGAQEFTELVHRLGGRVAIVTNRAAEVCDPTRRNLAAVGVRAHVVLCQEPGVSGKGGRFRAVEQGTTGADLPPVEIVLWIGDNIQDFPGLTQELATAPRAALDLFGRRYFVLPNPMYGSWERNPPR